MENQVAIFKIEKDIWNSFEEIDNIGLYTGLSGYILFYDSMFEVYKKEEYEIKLLKVIERTNELIQQTESLSSLSAGMAGYGIALLKLKNDSLGVEEEYFENIDDFLLKDFEEFYNNKNYDFMHQSMGIAVYFVERYKKNPSAKIIEILTKFSINLINGIRIDFKEVLAQNDESRGKHYSLGLAHGIASYINFLIYLKTNFLDLKEDINDSLHICIDFLISFRRYDEKSKQYYFNAISSVTDDYLSSRLSWCQGDLGISNAFYNAGIFLNDDKLVEEAKFLMNHSAKLKIENSGINDFGICHGSSGVLLQIYLASKKYEINFDSEIKYWLESLDEQTNDYENFNWYNNMKENYFPAKNLLVGSAGLGLVLLTVENKITTEWLEIFNLH